MTELKDFLYVLGSWVYAALTNKLVLLAIGGATRYDFPLRVGKMAWRGGLGQGVPVGYFRHQRNRLIRSRHGSHHYPGKASADTSELVLVVRHRILRWIHDLLDIRVGDL